MISKIKIKNFKCHKFMVLHFDKYVTTIKGHTDIGKSTIIKAIRLLTRNKPSGTSYISDNEKKTSVFLYADGIKIGRIRSKKENQYKIGDKTLKAFRSEPPEEVNKILNISDMNFQGQFDYPFWFKDTPGEISKRLNSIVNLSIIDSSLSNISNKVRNISNKLKFTSNRIKEINEQKDDLEYTINIDKDLKEIEKIKEENDFLQTKIEKISKIIKGGNKHQETIKKLNYFQNGWINLSNEFKKLYEINANNKILSDILQNIKDNTENIKSIPEIPYDIKNLIETCSLLSSKKDSIYRIISSINEQKIKEKKENERVLFLEKKRRDLIKGKCPICHRKMEI